MVVILAMWKTIQYMISKGLGNSRKELGKKSNVYFLICLSFVVERVGLCYQDLYFTSLFVVLIFCFQLFPSVVFK